MADLARIKRNVGKMVDQGAPENDINSYLSGEGVTAEQIRSAPKESMGSGEQYLRLFNSYIPGAARVSAGARSLLYGENYDDALKREFERTDTAQQTANPVLGTAARTAGLAATTLGTGGLNLLRSTLPEGAGLLQTIGESARIGAGMGAPIAYLDSRSPDAIGRSKDVLEGAIGGGVVGAAIPAAIGLATLPKRAIASSLRSGVQDTAAEFGAVGVPVTPAALSNNRLVQFASRHLADSPFGGPLTEQAARSVSGLDNSLARMLGDGEARATPAEAGQSIQNLLRRNLTQETRPSAEVRAMPPEQLQDMSGVAPGPGYKPKPPRVSPVNTPVEPVSPQSYLDEIAGSITPVKPRNAEVMPEYRTIPIDEIQPPAELRTRESLLQSEKARLESLMGAVSDEHAQLKQAVSPFEHTYLRDGGLDPNGVRRNPWPQTGYNVSSESDRVTVSRFRDVDKQLSELKKQHDDVSAELNNVYRTWAEQRPKLHAPMQEEANAAAGLEAAKRRAILRRDYAAEAERETQRLREAALEQARPRAEAEAQRLTEARRNQFAAIDRRETERLQREADAKFTAELESRKASSEPFRLGSSPESYPTEFAAAYEQTVRNAPKVQANFLGGKNDPTSTHVGSLLSDVRDELRRGYKLQGSAGVFDKSGRLDPALVRELRSRLGHDVTKTLLNAAEKRASGEFAPGIRGLHDVRTEVGRTMRAIRDSKYAATPRSEDHALLARLYKALDDDITSFASRAGDEGRTFLRQRGEIDKAYENYISDLRKPLSKLYGDKVTPEQAIGKLADAARENGGDINLLRSFFKVANDKGDPLRATKAILSQSANNGAMGFIENYRSLSPEAKRLMFSSPDGQQLRASIERLSKVADRLAPYMSAAERTGEIKWRDLTRGSNLLFGAGLYYSFGNTIALAGGSNLLARALASPKFGRWLMQVPSKAQGGISTGPFIDHMRRLQILAGDSPEIGEQVLHAVGQAIVASQANAAEPNSEPARPKAPLPGMMKLGGPDGKPQPYGVQQSPPPNPDDQRVSGIPPDISDRLKSLADQRQWSDGDRSRANDLMTTDFFLEGIDAIENAQSPTERAGLVERFMRSLDMTMSTQKRRNDPKE